MQLEMLEMKVTEEPNQSVAVSRWVYGDREFIVSMAGPLGMTSDEFIAAAKSQAEAFARQIEAAPKPLP